MNRTTNYNLCQFEETDRVRRTDFNEDNAKLDAAVKAVDRRVDSLDGSKASTSALNALTGRVTVLEQARFHIGSYVGNGAENRVIALPWAPSFMILFSSFGNDDAILFLAPGHRAFVIKDSVVTESPYLPELRGASIVFSNNYANTSGKNCWYILFR
ncbi:hypothetical protein N510_002402 [Firmicutes bacterium ASF500]|nr:hypothetical protein N510_002402 [Firmicutes bacterium ASF500]